MAPSPSEFNRQIRAAQRQAEQQFKRQVAEVNRKIDAQNKRVVADYNRTLDQHNRKVEAAKRQEVAKYNREVDQHNRRANAHNQRVVAEINRRLATAGRSQVRLTAQDGAIVDRVHEALPVDAREYDVFVSYARIDGAGVAGRLDAALRALGVTVWFDEIAIQPGRSQSLQMDQGLRKARAGVVVLTAAYLAGRFWTERELGALLHKPIVIPVLHQVTFSDVKEYSGILPDLAGFETSQDSVNDIAAKIAAAVLPAAQDPS